MGKKGKTAATFEVGNLVFAKVRGFSPWPAKITDVKGQNYHVMFFGTYEKAVCKASEIWIFDEASKKKFGNKKTANFATALQEIETNPDIVDNLPPPEAVKEEETTTTSDQELTDEPAKESPMKTGRKRKAGNTPQSAPTAKQRKTAERKSSRPIKEPKFFDDDTPARAPKPRDSPKKMWIKIKSTNQYVELCLDKNRPLEPETEAGEIIWDRQSAINALNKIEAIKSGFCLPEELRRILESKVNLTEAERAALGAYGNRKMKLDLLNTEQKILDLEHNIKKSLCLVDPDMNKAVDDLFELKEISMAKIIFKKRPHVVDTLRKLRKYVGPEKPSADPRETKEWEFLSGKIRKISDEILSKIKTLFSYDSADDFYDMFDKDVQKFKMATKDLSVDQFNLICADPVSSINKE